MDEGVPQVEGLLDLGGDLPGEGLAVPVAGGVRHVFVVLRLGDNSKSLVCRCDLLHHQAYFSIEFDCVGVFGPEFELSVRGHV